MKLAKYSLGTGDRFGMEGEAQLEAVMKAAARGFGPAIVWNKSFREHSIVGTKPEDVRKEADAAVKAKGFSGQYLVDADHVGLKTVEGFIGSSDFFTIDVADAIGSQAEQSEIRKFIDGHASLVGTHRIPGLGELTITPDLLQKTADRYLKAASVAREVYEVISRGKGSAPFIVEVSMDETAVPQSPAELFLILAMLAFYGIPAQTVAPRFSGRFNKGVEYVGDPEAFAREFEADILVIREAVKRFGLPDSLKLSVHSGSDKFSIYPHIKRLCRKHDAGVHLKTAGTTWLEECIGLAESGGEAAEFIKELYAHALGRFDELCKPYAEVIDIDRAALPLPKDVAGWDGARLARALRHDQTVAEYDPNMRQLLHVSYKLAAERKETFERLVRENRETVSRNVTANLLDRHIIPLFGE
jgi:hypothetical protein